VLGARETSWRSECGRVVLHCGDCLTLLPGLEAESVDAIVTDPPYSSGGMVRGDRMMRTRTKYQSTSAEIEHPDFAGDNRDQRGFHAWAALWLLHCRAAVQTGSVACIFSDWRQLPMMTDAIQSGGWVWRGVVPWDKVNARPMPNRFRAQCEFVVWGTAGPRDFAMSDDAKYHPGIIREPPPRAESRVHTTEKPIGALTPLVEVADRDGLILDPFMGSGSTGIAAIRTGRRFIGVELDPHYFAVAKRRIIAEMKQGALFAI